MMRAHRVEGFAIVSADGMLANAAGLMPTSLKVEADQYFFERALDRVDVVVHGRHSHERQAHSYLRHRLIVTRKIPALAPDPSNKRAMFWNPAGKSFEQALTALGTSDAVVGVVGGTNVFAMFLDSYELFHLSRAPNVWLPGGRPVFPDVPMCTPESVLTSHGLTPHKQQVFDQNSGVTLVSWQRQPKHFAITPKSFTTSQRPRPPL